MVRDWRLGVLQKSIMLLILLRIIVMGMIYKGVHLLEVPIFGSSRGQAQQPTMGGCDPLSRDCRSDFTPLSQLPYCLQYDASQDVSSDKKGSAKSDRIDTQSSDDNGSSNDDSAEQRRLLPKSAIKKTSKSPIGSPQADCVYWDAPAMTRGRSPVPGTLFLPTRIMEYRQVRGCQPSQSNGYACDTKPWVRKDGMEPQLTFIAEVERFQLLINQAFQSQISGHDVSGRAADFDAYIHGRGHLEDMHTKHQGFVKHVQSKLAAIVQNYEIPDGKPNASSPFQSVYAMNSGDMMSVADVMRMADVRGSAMLDQPREGGETMRTEGAVISMSIEYDNTQVWDFWGKAKPFYTITASYLPMRYYKIVYEDLISDDERLMLNVHGLLILMRVFGKVRVFSWTHLLTILTTAMVSLAMASTLTDYMMMYLFKYSTRYTIIKYNPTQDFGELDSSVTGLKRKLKDNYNPLTNKAVPTADVLNNAAENNGSCPRDRELLAILLKFEQRLNRLDGMDDKNAILVKKDPRETKDAGAAWLDDWEEQYEKQNMGVSA